MTKHFEHDKNSQFQILGSDNLAIHLPDEAILRGPSQFGWMYPVEGQLCTLKGLVRNATRPEGSIAEGYVAKEALTYLTRTRPASI